MKFSESWLRSFVNPPLDSAGLEHLLTMAGLEVEARQPLAPAFSGVVVGHILSAKQHPNADRLQVLCVDAGQGEPLQIICGAPNVRPGMKVPCALIGAVLPGEHRIEQALVCGVESSGTLCSAKELGLSDAHEGILELAADAPVGCDVRAWLHLDDTLFTLKLTPNRCDCMSVIGVAREVAALTGAPLTLPEIAPVQVTVSASRRIWVSEPQACPRYCGRVVQGVDTTVPTPAWMLRRLESSGLRGINAIVDITNYVLLELGQPLHAFDLAKLRGDIRVRFAAHQEKLLLLNQQEAKLQADMLVIADDDGAKAFAGIMGGAGSAVSDSTHNIFLESAFFSPAVIAGKARRLGLFTDSAYRFERGVDFAATHEALEYATRLILEICGGEAGPVTEQRAELPARLPVRLRVQYARKVLGIPIDAATIAALLSRLKFSFTQAGEEFEVTPPSYRFDITMEADLIEEVARLHGYDQVPATPPRGLITILPQPSDGLTLAELRQLLVAADYREAVTYSFINEEWERELHGNLKPIRLRNPIASNMNVMRSSMWGGLLDALRYNLKRKQERVRLFEIGACFLATASGYREVQRVAGLCYGSNVPEQWGEARREVDFYDVKANVEALAGSHARFEAAVHTAMHPGQSARVLLAGRAIGYLGCLHPKWQQRWQLPRGVVLFELDLAPLLARSQPRYAEIAKFPPVRRDIALVVDEAVTAQALLDTLLEARSEVVSEIALFDHYRGKGIAHGKKSLAFLVVMQDTQKTLTDEEADAAVSRLVSAAAQKFGAVLRG